MPPLRQTDPGLLPADPDPVAPRDALLRIGAALDAARCTGREGPFGVYDYSAYLGDAPPHQVRDFRDDADRPPGRVYGGCVVATHDAAEARRVYERLTAEHVARAAVRAVVAEVEAAGIVLLHPLDRDSSGPEAETRAELRRVLGLDPLVDRSRIRA